ncbi:MAG: DUF421 domain-containing protein [Lachnospiraceae bacterium]|nr:DUF421 domain-containing protein [Lachnospiraceae bacterium]
MPDLLQIVILSVASIVTLFILTKLMGYRQMSQMSMFDYINGITIGSIAAEMATALDENPLHGIVAMTVYALIAVLLSFLSMKSIKLRRLIVGRPVILLNNGSIYEKNLRKAKIDINEFLTQCRVAGYFDISKLQSAVLEADGRISFLPLSTERPLTAADVKLSPEQETMTANVVIDGHIMQKNLLHTGKDETWLHRQLKAQGTDNIRDVLLASVDMQNKLTVFLKNSDERKKDLFI